MVIDPFSLASGVVGILGLALEVTETIHSFTSSVSAAHEESANLALEVEQLSCVLQQFASFLRSDKAKDIAFQPTSGICNVMGLCQGQLQGLRTMLGKLDAPGKGKLARAVERLKW